MEAASVSDSFPVFHEAVADLGNQPSPNAATGQLDRKTKEQSGRVVEVLDLPERDGLR
jgi:hypothetical protein